MRVAHVASSVTYGGAENVVVELATGQALAGIDVAIVGPAGRLDRDWSRLGIERRFVPRAGRAPHTLARATVAVARALRSWRPDLVHAHNVKATGVALAARQVCPGRPLVLTTLHGVPPRQMRPAARILRQAELVAAVSDEVRDAAVAGGLRPDGVVVVHNGIGEMPALSQEQIAGYDRELSLSRNVVAAVGRLVPQKAHHLFLEAVAVLLRSVPDTTALLIGDGPLEGELKRRAADLGIEDHLRFTGVRLDARQLIERADVLVFSSIWEGHSIAALEALAAGTPVVSTDVAGMRKLLRSGGGTIVGNRDPASIAEAVAELLRDPAARRRMGDAGRRLVADEFSNSQMRERYLELYARVLQPGVNTSPPR